MKADGSLAIDWEGFREYCGQKYSESWGKRVVRYAERYEGLLLDPTGLERLTDGLRGNVLKSLTALSKFLGCYGGFKAQVKAAGIKWSKSSSVDSFLRIMGASDKSEELLEWLEKARKQVGKPSIRLYLKFAALSGLRRSEAIESFNQIIALSQERGGLESYYDREKGALEHYKYPEQFLRTTKNVFFSLVPEELIEEIAASEPITYSMIKGRLYRKKMRMRVDELRDHWGTFMLDHGLKREEVDLLQGRIPKSVFVRHYWSPALLELRNRVFKALDQLRTEVGDLS